MNIYQPTVLRHMRTISHKMAPCFAIGIFHNKQEYGMTHGPVPDLIDMLEIVPEKNSRILFFDADGETSVVARWDHKNEVWVLRKNINVEIKNGMSEVR